MLETQIKQAFFTDAEQRRRCLNVQMGTLQILISFLDTLSTTDAKLRIGDMDKFRGYIEHNGCTIEDW